MSSNDFNGKLVRLFDVKTVLISSSAYKIVGQKLQDSCKNKIVFNVYKSYLSVSEKELVQFLLCLEIKAINYYYDLSFDANYDLNKVLEHDIVLDAESIMKVIVEQSDIFDLVGDDYNIGTIGYFYPFNFVCHAIMRYLRDKVAYYVADKNNNVELSGAKCQFFYSTISELLNTIDAILLCIERNRNDLGNAYTLLRSALEKYASLNALIKATDVNPMVIQAYYDFCNISVSSNDKDSIHAQMNNRFNVSNFKQRYGFGWLMIPNSGFVLKDDKGKDKSLAVFEDVLKNSTLDQNVKDCFLEAHNISDQYVHGNFSTWDTTKTNYYHVCYYIGQLLDSIIKDLKKAMGNNILDFKHNNTDLYILFADIVDECLEIIKSVKK